MLSGYGKREWLTILVIGLMLSGTCVVVRLWWAAIPILIVTGGLLSFFRDPNRRIPAQRAVMVSPADGRVSSIHRVEHFESFDGPAICVRIFLSVLNVHVNRSPCHALVSSVTYTPGKHLNALNPESAEVNESTLIVLLHPVRRHPIAGVRQVAGLLARTIACVTEEGEILQRGERYGMIKFGSTTELYVPEQLRPEVLVRRGENVQGGQTILVKITPLPSDQPDAQDTEEQSPAATPVVSETIES